MRISMTKAGLMATAMLLVATGIARADCESDLVQLEEAYKVPNLKPEARAALDEAKTKSVSALKKDDDAGCHQAIAHSLAKVGIPLK